MPVWSGRGVSAVPSLADGVPDYEMCIQGCPARAFLLSVTPKPGVFGTVKRLCDTCPSKASYTRSLTACAWYGWCSWMQKLVVQASSCTGAAVVSGPA